MLEEFNSRGSRDFRQRYEGCYGFFKPPQAEHKLMVLLRGIQEDRLSFLDENGISMEAVADRGHVFEFIPVQRKLFLYNNRLHYISRRPARQWQRGISDNNTQVRDITRGEFVSVNFKRLQAALDDGPPKLSTLEKYCKEKVAAFLISQHFGVSDEQVFLYNTVIGTFDKETSTITLTEPVFKQELSDAIREAKFPLKVEG